MSVKFYCKICNKEIWQNMNVDIKNTTTISEAEFTAICSMCLQDSGIVDFGLPKGEGGADEQTN